MVVVFLCIAIHGTQNLYTLYGGENISGFQTIRDRLICSLKMVQLYLFCLVLPLAQVCMFVPVAMRSVSRSELDIGRVFRMTGIDKSASVVM